jgi:putative ABC transport system ATP-binding protein
MVKDWLGARIKSLREAKGLTQVQLGERVGVDGMTISRWERGDFLPLSSRIVPLAKALQVDLETLLDEPKKGRTR